MEEGAHVMEIHSVPCDKECMLAPILNHAWDSARDDTCCYRGEMAAVEGKTMLYRLDNGCLDRMKVITRFDSRFHQLSVQDMQKKPRHSTIKKGLALYEVICLKPICFHMILRSPNKANMFPNILTRTNGWASGSRKTSGRKD